MHKAKLSALHEGRTEKGLADFEVWKRSYDTALLSGAYDNFSFFGTYSLQKLCRSSPAGLFILYPTSQVEFFKSSLEAIMSLITSALTLLL